MKKRSVLVLSFMVIIAAMMAGCGIASGPQNTDFADSDYMSDFSISDYSTSDYDDSGYVWFDTGTNDNKRYSILTDPSEYEHGYSSPYYQEHTRDPRFEDATLMYDYEGKVYSGDIVDLEFQLTDVSNNGDQIQVVFSKCQYPYSGIDLGYTYTGYLYDISGGYVPMDGVYSYEIPFMDLYEDGSRHPNTFYLEFSFGSKDAKGEFCMSKIGLLTDTMYMQ